MLCNKPDQPSLDRCVRLSLNIYCDSLLEFFGPPKNNFEDPSPEGAGIEYGVWRLATGWTIRGSNPGGGEIFRTYPDRAWGSPSLLYNGYRVFPGGNSGQGVTLTTHPHLMPKSRKSRVIPLHPLWASVACYRVKPYLALHYLHPSSREA